MAVREAMVIDESYLHSEDAPGLDDVTVFVSQNTVDLTTKYGNVLSLDFDDWDAISRKVRKAREQPQEFPVNLRIPDGFREAMESTVQAMAKALGEYQQQELKDATRCR